MFIKNLIKLKQLYIRSSAVINPNSFCNFRYLKLEDLSIIWIVNEIGNEQQIEEYLRKMLYYISKNATVQLYQMDCEENLVLRFQRQKENPFPIEVLELS